MSLPYEPGRDAFASLSRTSDDLNALAESREELPPNPGARSAPLAHLERALFGEQARSAPELDGSIRFLEGAGLRGTLELVAEELLALLRSGTEADQIAIVCPSLERWRAPLDTAFTTLGVPYALEGRLRLGQTPFGQALLALLRYAWLEGDRRDLFAFLRSPYSGLARHHVDFLEGRLRGRGVVTAPRAWRRRSPSSEASRCRTSTRCAVQPTRSRRSRSSRARWRARPTASSRRRPASPRGSTCGRTRRRARLVTELEGWRDLGGEVTATRSFALLDDAPVRLAGAGEAGPRRRARPAARPHPPVRGRLRARAGGGPPAAPRAELAVPRRGAEGRARALVPLPAGSCAPTRSRATATSSTRPARARRGGSTSSARPPATRARRASRARSGTRRASSSPPTRPSAGRGDGRWPR